MLDPPEGFDERALLAMVEEQYCVSGEPLEFVPRGEDSWCYRVGELWVSLRRDLRGHVPAAYEAARLLHDNGLDFVLAPLRGANGKVSQTVADLPVIVFPYLPVTQLDVARPSPREVERAVELLKLVHEARVTVAIPSEAYELPFEADLDLIAGVADSDPGTGPYSGRLGRLLRAHRDRIADLRAEFAELAGLCARSSGRLVLTHGEPIPANLLRRGDRLLIADWGEALWGPPERDWSHLARTLGAGLPCRPEFKRLYDIRWILSEVAEYVSVFTQPHSGGADDAAMWSRLLRYLPEPDQPARGEC